VRKAVVVLAAVLILGIVNWTIASREAMLASGRVVLLELAPVDPRSLMQGDYMALHFRITDNMSADASGSAALRIDARGVATLDPQPTQQSPRIRYRIRNGAIWLGTNAYFFEEGRGERYAPAQYGEFRLDPDSGEAVLVGLADENLKPL